MLTGAHFELSAVLAGRGVPVPLLLSISCSPGKPLRILRTINRSRSRVRDEPVASGDCSVALSSFENFILSPCSQETKKPTKQKTPRATKVQIHYDDQATSISLPPLPWNRLWR